MLKVFVAIKVLQLRSTNGKLQYLTVRVDIFGILPQVNFVLWSAVLCLTNWSIFSCDTLFRIITYYTTVVETTMYVIHYDVSNPPSLLKGWRINASDFVVDNRCHNS